MGIILRRSIIKRLSLSQQHIPKHSTHSVVWVTYDMKVTHPNFIFSKSELKSYLPPSAPPSERPPELESAAAALPLLLSLSSSTLPASLSLPALPQYEPAPSLSPSTAGGRGRYGGEEVERRCWRRSAGEGMAAETMRGGGGDGQYRGGGRWRGVPAEEALRLHLLLARWPRLPEVTTPWISSWAATSVARGSGRDGGRDEGRGRHPLGMRRSASGRSTSAAPVHADAGPLHLDGGA